MCNRWIFTGILTVLGLLTGPATHTAQAEPWDLSGNTAPTTWLPTGPYQHDGSGFYSGLEFTMLYQHRAIGAQLIAIRGINDTSGLLSGTPGTFLGSGEEALRSDQLGRGSWSPGSRITVGYRFENGWNFSLSWLHSFDTKYSGGAGSQGPSFSNIGPNLENTFLFAPVFNFSQMFVGPVARLFTGGPITTNGVNVFGAVNGIWNGASEMTIVFSQRYDNWDATARIPVFETENARSYSMAGGRFSWIWERFQWRTNTTGIDIDNIPEGTPPQSIERSDWAARYTNTLSQRMYGPFLGVGHEVWMGNGFSAGIECSGAILLDYVKERAKYIREDQATQAKRTWNEYRIVPNVNMSANLTWQPIEGITLRIGYNAMQYFNTLYMKEPVGFNVGAIDPAYKTKAYRLLHGTNVGVGFIW